MRGKDPEKDGQGAAWLLSGRALFAGFVLLLPTAPLFGPGACRRTNVEHGQS